MTSCSPFVLGQWHNPSVGRAQLANHRWEEDARAITDRGSSDLCVARCGHGVEGRTTDRSGVAVRPWITNSPLALTLGWKTVL